MNTQITLANLFNDNLPSKYRDKVFWFASKVTNRENTIDIFIDTNDCLVGFDDVAEELDIKTINQISQLKPQTDNPVLVSSGSFLWINNKLLVTQRTADTKYDPSYWTAPAGRCDTTPLKTAYKETAEEIHGFDKTTNETWMPTPCLPFLNNNTINGYEVVNDFPDGFDFSLKMVNTWVNDKLVETAHMWAYYSESVNTLELRVPISANIDNELYFRNPESDSKACLMSIGELQDMDVVPAVKELLKEF